MAAALTRALGQEVRYNDVSPEAYRAFGFPGAEDLGNMFQFKRDFEAYFCGERSLDLQPGGEPVPAELRHLAGEERHQNSTRLTQTRAPLRPVVAVPAFHPLPHEAREASPAEALSASLLGGAR